MDRGKIFFGLIRILRDVMADSPGLRPQPTYHTQLCIAFARGGRETAENLGPIQSAIQQSQTVSEK